MAAPKVTQESLYVLDYALLKVSQEQLGKVCYTLLNGYLADAVWMLVASRVAKTFRKGNADADDRCFGPKQGGGGVRRFF